MTAAETSSGQLEFDAEKHIYRCNGEVMPSVTQILKAARLIDYSMIPQVVLQKASRRGTAVHQALALIDDGDMDLCDVDAEYFGYAEAALNFYRDAQFEPHLVEFRNYHRLHRYAGTLDRTGLMAGTMTIVDFKTGIILPGHALQLAAYLAMLENPRSYRRIALKLNEDGTYRVTEFPSASQRDDLDVFLSALRCWRFNEIHKNGHATDRRLF